jgi:hypothetical protein
MNLKSNHIKEINVIKTARVAINMTITDIIDRRGYFIIQVS